MAEATLMMAALLSDASPGPSVVLVFLVGLLVVMIAVGLVLAREVTRRDAPLGHEGLLDGLLADRASFDAYFAVHGVQILSALSARESAAAHLGARLGHRDFAQALAPIAMVSGGSGLLCLWTGSPERQGADAPVVHIDEDGQWHLLATSLMVLIQRLTVPVRILPGPSFAEDVDWCMAEMAPACAPWEVHYRRFRQWAGRRGLHASLDMVAAASAGVPCRGDGADVCEASIAAWWAALVLDDSALP